MMTSDGPASFLNHLYLSALFVSEVGNAEIWRSRNLNKDNQPTSAMRAGSLIFR